jgi:site-specific recombinase
MAEALDRPLSQHERLRKAEAMLEEGTVGFESALEADEELDIRRRASVSCETAFHALAVVSDALIMAAGREPPRSHDARIEVLQDINRSDLADLYQRAQASLHTSCYYGQRVGRIQKDTMRELVDAVRNELAKYH